MDVDERMTALCRTIPYLSDKVGFGEGWDTALAFPDSESDQGEAPFPAWALGSSAAIECVRFARHVWNANNPPPSLAFWDRRHLEAYLAWARQPWWG